MKVGPNNCPSQILDRMLATLPPGEDKAKPPSMFRRDNVIGMQYMWFRDIAIKAYNHCIGSISRKL